MNLVELGKLLVVVILNFLK